MDVPPSFEWRHRHSKPSREGVASRERRCPKIQDGFLGKALTRSLPVTAGEGAERNDDSRESKAQQGGQRSDDCAFVVQIHSSRYCTEIEPHSASISLTGARLRASGICRP
jgi:hypothetical protein